MRQEDTINERTDPDLVDTSDIPEQEHRSKEFERMLEKSFARRVQPPQNILIIQNTAMIVMALVLGIIAMPTENFICRAALTALAVVTCVGLFAALVLRVVERMAVAQRSRVPDLKKEIKRLNDALSEETSRKLQEDLEDTKIQIENLEEEFGWQRDENRALHEELENICAKRDVLAANNRKLQEANVRLQEQKDALEAECRQVVVASGQHVAFIAQLLAERFELQRPKQQLTEAAEAIRMLNPSPKKQNGVATPSHPWKMPMVTPTPRARTSENPDSYHDPDHDTVHD
jgi:hypothetical protein